MVSIGHMICCTLTTIKTNHDCLDKLFQQYWAKIEQLDFKILEFHAPASNLDLQIGIDNEGRLRTVLLSKTTRVNCNY